MKDSTQEDPVWLHAKMANETGERRALVHSISVQYKSSWFGTEATVEDMPLVVTIVRGPYWESTTARNLPDDAPSAAACVVYDYTAAGDAVGAHDIVGDVGARIRQFSILTPGNGDLSAYWMGIRSANKHGATGISNFAPVWELEDGNNATDVTDTVDAVASGGYNITVSESVRDWDDGEFHLVSTINLGDVTAYPEDQLGKFLWLLRATASTSTWEVRLQLHSGVSVITQDPVELSTAVGYHWQPLSISKIPLHSIRSINTGDYAATNFGEVGVKIHARRTSGSDDLKLDCLALIPVDEGSLYLDVVTDPVAIEEMIGESPSGQFQAIRKDTTDDGIHDYKTILDPNNFRLPPGDGRIYCVYETSPDVLSETITFNDGDVGRYYERWLSLKGKDGTDIDFSVSDGITLGDTETVSIP
jgi:hypothetical protein